VFDLFQLPFAQRALVEVLVLAVGAGLVGCWIVLRGLAFFSHAVGTAAFPGLVLADGLGFAPTLGAFGVALLFALAVARLAAQRRAGYDSLTALVLVGALAAGVILASDVFQSGSQVDALLFGSLLVVGTDDIVLAAAASVLALGASLALGRRWLAIGFDPDGAGSLGLRSPAYDLVLLGLVAVTAVAALSIVGALLATALLVVPAATTRLWVDRLGAWQAATVALVAVEGVVGLWLSLETNAPPGATIAVVAGALFAAASVARALRPRLHARTALAGAALLGALALAGCGDDAGSGDGDQVKVVATTTQIADFVREVGGGDVDVTQLLQPNTDPHEYEPRPADVKATAGAKLVFRNGGDLDEWMDDLVDQAGGDPQVVDLGAGLPVRLKGEDEPFDPHWWHDPADAQAAVEQIRDALVSADPSHRSEFERNATAYLDRLRALNAGIERCFATVPSDRRKLVSDHDAFNYFVSRYGIRYIGAVIPSQTTEAQPSAGDVADLVALIRREKVAAVFPEESLSPKLAESIARQTGATADYTLYGDALGPKGSAGDTYLRMEQANADAMVRGFTGGRQRCRVPGIS
jgi:ABC-type Zn uptake system ZnuABC Zn-binding protein ZnuA/ABC-type Mn2+/Zn2+ transport system permease subunit